MKQVLIKNGGAVVEETGAPQLEERSLLVSVNYSCISVGTEMASVTLSGLPLYRRALQQPANVRKVLDMVREQGLQRTYDRVTGKLAAGSPTGYSAAGRVIAAGSQTIGFNPGDEVACAGAGIANHAEVISVPVNLAARVPAGLDLRVASTVTLGAIAMQGVRRCQPTLGETVVVVGLGILGQITAQLLQANGCRVMAVDTDASRVQLACDHGAAFGVLAGQDSYIERAAAVSDGFGADAVIITAAGASDAIISEAMRACRKKGRVVLVGDVGLKLNRADFYSKELDFLISTSYGPGRYDPAYEEAGHDYPVGYVRWTENRNMEAYLNLLAAGQVRLDKLLGPPYPIERAAEAYAALKQPEQRPIAVTLQYPGCQEPLRRTIAHAAPAGGGAIRLAVIGAGGFAQGMHLPNLAKLRGDFQLRWVASRTGANAKAVATQFGAAFSTTDYREALADPEVDLVIIATRHDLHARLALAALQAGKHVLLEKPLALNEDELRPLVEFFAAGGSIPVLMTGFNRRFSPAMAAAAKALRERATPLLVNYRMNAGYVPLSHWTQTAEGGGRNLGEACHIYDLFNFLTGSQPTRVQAAAVAPRGKQWARSDNFTATLEYGDGSVCSLSYTALGHREFPKETMEIFVDGKVLSLLDYRCLTLNGQRKLWESKTTQKGQAEELRALARSLRAGGGWPIPWEQQLSATRAGFEVERQIGQATGSEAPSACAE